MGGSCKGKRCGDDLAFLEKRALDEEKSKPQAERNEMSLLERLKFVIDNDAHMHAVDLSTSAFYALRKALANGVASNKANKQVLFWPPCSSSTVRAGEEEEARHWTQI